MEGSLRVLFKNFAASLAAWVMSLRASQGGANLIVKGWKSQVSAEVRSVGSIVASEPGGIINNRHFPCLAKRLIFLDVTVFFVSSHCIQIRSWN